MVSILRLPHGNKMGSDAPAITSSSRQNKGGEKGRHIHPGCPYINCGEDEKYSL